MQAKTFTKNQTFFKPFRKAFTKLLRKEFICTISIENHFINNNNKFLRVNPIKIYKGVILGIKKGKGVSNWKRKVKAQKEKKRVPYATRSSLIKQHFLSKERTCAKKENMSLKEKRRTWCKSTRGREWKGKPKLKERFLVKVFTEGKKVV